MFCAKRELCMRLYKAIHSHEWNIVSFVIARATDIQMPNYRNNPHHSLVLIGVSKVFKL